MPSLREAIVGSLPSEAEQDETRQNPKKTNDSNWNPASLIFCYQRLASQPLSAVCVSVGYSLPSQDQGVKK
jgi:hypothetical protein